MILYINSCVRHGSRTDFLARRLLAKLGDATEVTLEHAGLAPLNRQTLALRTELAAKGDFTHPMFANARQFASADTIVIAAPYWDLSYPALLKTYLENIYVVGLVTRYGADGVPHGLCKAKELYYVTTAGGAYDRRYSYDQIADMAKNCFGIPRTYLIYAEMLDIAGYDADEIIARCAQQI